MSSLSSSASSASSTRAHAASSPERAAARPYASSFSVGTTGEAGPSSSSSLSLSSDRRAERRRSTLSGSDRKRRLVQDGDAWLRRAASGDSVEAGPSRRPSDSNSRSISSGSSRAALPGASYATAIDLSSSSPPHPPPPPPSNSRPPSGDRRSSWSRSGSNYLEYVRPRWQPDTEVTECPICGVPFSFWYRKHHCRKCGRVVCSSCSPHRITIPRQFIVRPPDSSVAPLVPPRAAQLFDTNPVPNATINPALGGGEEVRLCNPCVPDPNPDPPRGYTTLRPCPGQPNQSRHRSYHSLSIPNRPPSYSTAHDNFSRPGRRTVGSNEYPTMANLGGSLGSRLSERAIEYGHMSGRVPMTAHPPAVYPPTPRLPQPVPAYGTHPAVQDRRRVDERDLCPICDNPLPPLGANGNEDLREAHIRGCIESHGRQPGSPQSGSPTQPALPVRLIAFNATEKDCLGHDGTTQECTICMEDYEVGQVLVRLECLCKFHKRCIVEWFERKKECPVHKVS